MPAKVSLPRNAALTLTLSLALSMALGALPASARTQLRHQPERKAAERVNKDPFGNIPKGQLQIIISINQQKLHLYSDGAQVADTSIATGVPSLPTPTGVFSVIQKQVFHRSNIYSNAPMPFMQRITWSGVAMHEGEGIGHQASHGCIRMPRDFAMRLYRLTKLGVPVVIARGELKPSDFADPHLFEHKVKPPDQIVAAPAATAPTQTAQTTTGGTATDAAVPSTAATAAKPSDLGLRASNDAGPGMVASTPGDAKLQPVAADTATPAPTNSVPTSTAEPASPARALPTSKAPIAIFISRKTNKIYVRQDFAPLFEAPITIADSDKPFGTHVFTAMGYTGDDHTVLRWNVISLPEAPPKVSRKAEREERYDRYAKGRRRVEVREKEAGDQPPPQTPAEALARISIPPDAIDFISQLIVPGSTLIVSDQGLGEETGEGTNFVVVTR